MRGEAAQRPRAARRFSTVQSSPRGQRRLQGLGPPHNSRRDGGGAEGSSQGPTTGCSRRAAPRPDAPRLERADRS
jgi:hypothetical protein